MLDPVNLYEVKILSLHPEAFSELGVLDKLYFLFVFVSGKKPRFILHLPLHIRNFQHSLVLVDLVGVLLEALSLQDLIKIFDVFVDFGLLCQFIGNDLAIFFFHNGNQNKL